MHLASLYSRDLGVNIDKPILFEHYYPIPYEKYITIHTSNKVPAKNYSYWGTVVKILKKVLAPKNIKIIQIGTREDPLIEGVDEFINNTTLNQSFFIIKNALCHVGIDSCPVHLAASYNIPTVAIYGHTYSSTCDTAWTKSTVPHIKLEPERGKKCPSFSLNENPKSVDSILPEEFANAVFKQLKIWSFETEETIHIGSKFLHKTIDVILSENNTLTQVDENVNLRIRFDISPSEHLLAKQLSEGENKFEIITNVPINENLIENFKPRIKKIVYSNSQFDEKFLNYLRYSNITFELNCLDESKLNEERHKFFHFDILLEEGLKEFSKKEKILLEKYARNGKLKIDTSKFYFKNGQIIVQMPNEGFNSPNFLKDSQYYRFYINYGSKKK